MRKCLFLLFCSFIGLASAQGVISGTVFAPSGGDVYGTYVIACYPDGNENCDENLTRYVQISQGGTSAPFELRNLATAAYALIIWQDINGNGEIDEGEPLAFYSDGGSEAALVTPPAEGIGLRFDAVPSAEASPSSPAQPAPTSDQLAVEPGVVKGVVRNSQGQPLAGARLEVVDASNRYGSSIATSTDASGAYRVNVPVGSWVVYGSYPLNYNGTQLCLPLEDDNAEGFWHADGAVRNFTLKISGERRFSDGSLGHWGGTLVVNTRFGSDPWGNDPLQATLRFVLEPDGPLMDGSTGDRVVRTGTVNLRDNFEIGDIPLGRYWVEAGLVEANGAVTPLLVRAYLDDDLTDNNIITFDDVVRRSCGSIVKSSDIILSPLD